MKNGKIIFHIGSSQKYTLLFGGIAFMLLGLYLLSIHIQEQQSTLNLSIDLFFLLLGLASLISLMDNLKLIITKDVIEVKSLFRKKVIPRNEITGYGIRPFEGKYMAGETIKIISPRTTISINSTYYKNGLHIKQYLKGKKRLHDLFKWTNLLNDVLFPAIVIGGALFLLFLAVRN